ncbi:hypothetical protein U9M48_032146 [Paspalum notatum var. saurae]|uniref:Uncharacterized protein n=1 Tax=Paspalum notatum var. saurae TaxID=547442 RepID=A0AAQ3X555_PASNO
MEFSVCMCFKLTILLGSLRAKPKTCLSVLIFHQKAEGSSRTPVSLTSKRGDEHLSSEVEEARLQLMWKIIEAQGQDTVEPLRLFLGIESRLASTTLSKHRDRHRMTILVLFSSSSVRLSGLHGRVHAVYTTRYTLMIVVSFAERFNRLLMKAS